MTRRGLECSTMHWRPVNDRRSPVTTTSWRSIALTTVLFVLAPIAITVVVSQPVIAVVPAVAMTVIGLGRVLPVTAGRTGDPPRPEGQCC